MHFFKNLHHFAYVETFVLTLSYLLVGYLVEPEDILFIQSDLSSITGFLAIMTLFFGLGCGLFSLGMLTTFMYLDYPHFEYQIFLKELVLVFIFGIFHIYWIKKITYYRKKNTILESRFTHLSKAFYALKVSHDQLEMNYVLKPVSIRRSLVQIVEKSSDNTQDQWHHLAILLEKSFGISKLTLCTIEDGEFVVKTASSQKIDPTNHLIQKALEKNLPVYISDDAKDSAKYIAVIPASFKEETKALLLIEEMPFISFNEDNMRAIRFIFDYFFLMLHQKEILSRFDILPQFKKRFRLAYINQYELYKKYQINSTFIVFKTNDALVSHRLNDAIEEALRELDLYDTIKRGNTYISVIMAPFTANISAKSLKERVLETLLEKEKNTLEITLFSFSDKSLFERYIGEE